MYSKYIYRSFIVVCGQNDSQNARVGSMVKNMELTYFDHYSYLPLKFRAQSEG